MLSYTREKLDRIIITIKSWQDDMRMNCMPNESFKDYIKPKVVLVEKNYEFIENFEYLKKMLVDND